VPRDRECSSHIASIAVILSSGIEKNYLAVIEWSIVGNIMENSCVRACPSDDAVRLVVCASRYAGIEEDSFNLPFVLE
jgi:hypothetical protein